VVCQPRYVVCHSARSVAERLHTQFRKRKRRQSMIGPYLGVESPLSHFAEDRSSELSPKRTISSAGRLVYPITGLPCSQLMSSTANEISIAPSLDTSQVSVHDFLQTITSSRQRANHKHGAKRRSHSTLKHRNVDSSLSNATSSDGNSWTAMKSFSTIMSGEAQKVLTQQHETGDARPKTRARSAFRLLFTERRPKTIGKVAQSGHSPYNQSTATQLTPRRIPPPPLLDSNLRTPPKKPPVSTRASTFGRMNYFVSPITSKRKPRSTSKRWGKCVSEHTLPSLEFVSVKDHMLGLEKLKASVPRLPIVTCV
jgi:hypothetical protein